MRTIEPDTPQTISYDQGYAIRGIAMLLIMFVHSINEYQCYESSLSRALLIPMFGTLGCSIFFFMSGYGITTSLSKDKTKQTTRNLLTHIRKIITPVLVVYIINSILLPQTSSYNDLTIDHYNILKLNLPEGTDIWFIKVILFDYITTFVLFKSTISTKKKLTYIILTQTVLVATLYLCQASGYWYISNLCFVLGAIHTIHPIFKKQYILTAILVFTIYYLCIINCIISAPIQILGNLAFATIVVNAIKIRKYYPQWLIYIGKNSLLYYILNIPIMWLIPSNDIHFILYFALNIILTTIFISIYKKVEKTIIKTIQNR
jgi:peptidoglycan/LPS O-acetylase OafA/YrhL